MPRKNFGMLDEALMDRVDAEAKRLGQNRRTYTERALDAWLRATRQQDANSDLPPVELTGVAAERAEAILAKRDQAKPSLLPKQSGLVHRQHTATCKCAMCSPDAAKTARAGKRS